MPSKDKILKSIRSNRDQMQLCPSIRRIRFATLIPVANFSTVLQQIGGTAIRVKNLAEVNYRIAEQPELATPMS